MDRIPPVLRERWHHWIALQLKDGEHGQRLEHVEDALVVEPVVLQVEHAEAGALEQPEQVVRARQVIIRQVQRREERQPA